MQAKIEAALVRDYIGKGQEYTYETYPDPHYDGVYAVRLFRWKNRRRKEMVDLIYFAASDDFTEGEFKCWPPESRIR